MKTTTTFSLIMASVLAGPFDLQRREGFIESHQRQGHLPGGGEDGFLDGMISQARSFLGSSASTIGQYTGYDVGDMIGGGHDDEESGHGDDHGGSGHGDGMEADGHGDDHGSSGHGAGMETGGYGDGSSGLGAGMEAGGHGDGSSGLGAGMEAGGHGAPMAKDETFAPDMPSSGQGASPGRLSYGASSGDAAGRGQGPSQAGTPSTGAYSRPASRKDDLFDDDVDDSAEADFQSQGFPDKAATSGGHASHAESTSEDVDEAEDVDVDAEAPSGILSSFGLGSLPIIGGY